MFTVNEIGFADTIGVECDDTIGMPSTGDSLAANDGYGWVYYSVSYKFTGEEELNATASFMPIVEYGKETFLSPCVRFLKYDGDWRGLDYHETPIGVPLPATDTFYKYDPYAEKDYELHGAVQVPLKAFEDTETPLTLVLQFGENDKIKCTTNIEPAPEPTEEERLYTFTYEDREFFKEYVADLTPMTEDEIASVITGNTFNMRNNHGIDFGKYHSITFYEDGKLDAKYTYEGEEYIMYESWEIKDGSVVLTNSFTNNMGEYTTTDYQLTPYQYDDTRYLLMDMNSDNSMVLITK